jgi:flagellar biosynthesis protein FlhF
MQLHTFKARSLAEALQLVHDRLGPEASVLQTREVGSTWSRWLGGPHIEVTASAEIQVPSRLPSFAATLPAATRPRPRPQEAEVFDFRRKVREDLFGQSSSAETSLVEQLALQELHQETHTSRARSEVEAWSPGYAAPRFALPPGPTAAEDSVRIPLCDPIELHPTRRTVVALVGPTGVGKTTTIAKLAAQFRLRDEVRVGLVTVDTYRIAAVEQLRTYAEIMDLPLEVVTTPREMRAALGRLEDFDLVLVDTAGRSPRDAVRLAELRALLAESQANEIHAVLSAVAGRESLETAVDAFSTVGASAVILTKLDEAGALPWLPELLTRCRLPVSYTTHGQNVPDDISPAIAGGFLTRLLAQ